MFAWFVARGVGEELSAGATRVAMNTVLRVFERSVVVFAERTSDRPRHQESLSVAAMRGCVILTAIFRELGAEAGSLQAQLRIIRSR